MTLGDLLRALGFSISDDELGEFYGINGAEELLDALARLPGEALMAIREAADIADDGTLGPKK